MQSTLKSLHVDVECQSKRWTQAPTGDQAATYQEANTIAHDSRRPAPTRSSRSAPARSSGPRPIQAEESPYNPSWVATNASSVVTAVIASSITPAYLKNMVTTSPILDNYQTWHQPADQRCYQVVHKAYPDDRITPPSNPITGSDQSFFAVEDTCDNLALFTAVAKGAGKDLTRASFIKAGYTLRVANLPGSAAPVSFGPGRPYPLGPVYIGRYDAAKNSVQFSSASG